MPEQPLKGSDWSRALLPHSGSNPSPPFLITLGPLLAEQMLEARRR